MDETPGAPRHARGGRPTGWLAALAAPSAGRPPRRGGGLVGVAAGGLATLLLITALLGTRTSPLGRPAGLTTTGQGAPPPQQPTSLLFCPACPAARLPQRASPAYGGALIPTLPGAYWPT